MFIPNFRNVLDSLAFEIRNLKVGNEYLIDWIVENESERAKNYSVK